MSASPHMDRELMNLVAKMKPLVDEAREAMEDHENGIEIRAIADDELETARLFRPGNCLRATNPRVVVCHCASCGGK